MSRKKTQAEFIAEAKAVHGDRYDYSLVRYVNTHNKVVIMCNNHGSFNQIPKTHIKGSGCPKCNITGGWNKSNKDDFVKKAIGLHGDKYDYSKVKYRESKVKVEIICSDHGSFYQIPNRHLLGSGCPSCGGTKKKTTVDFILQAKETHGNIYEYSSSEYLGTHKKVVIKCKEHGKFLQWPTDHWDGAGCPKCSATIRGEARLITLDDFIIKAGIVHKDKYDYSLVKYKGGKVKVKIICKKHGIFEQMPFAHTVGQGCPKCNSSKGELAIDSFLSNQGICFENQKRFPKCKSKKPLPYDFYIPSEKLLIEFDGKQHFECLEVFGGAKELKETQRRDKIKNEFAKAHGYNLLRIKYTDYDNIEQILTEALNIKEQAA